MFLLIVLRRDMKRWDQAAAPDIELGHRGEGVVAAGPEMGHGLVQSQASGGLPTWTACCWFCMWVMVPARVRHPTGSYKVEILILSFFSTFINWQFCLKSKISEANMTIICRLCHRLVSLDSSELQFLYFYLQRRLFTRFFFFIDSFIIYFLR